MAWAAQAMAKAAIMRPPAKWRVRSRRRAAAEDVTGQVFAVRNNEICLMDQSRPQRGMQHCKGWTPQSVPDHAFPALPPNFYGLDRTADVFSREPV